MELLKVHSGNIVSDLLYFTCRLNILHYLVIHFAFSLIHRGSPGFDSSIQPVVASCGLIIMVITALTHSFLIGVTLTGDMCVQ